MSLAAEEARAAAGADNIWRAAMRGDLKAVTALSAEASAAGTFDVDAQSEFGRTALHQACLSHQPHVVNDIPPPCSTHPNGAPVSSERHSGSVAARACSRVSVY